jgi:hypothetical protein
MKTTATTTSGNTASPFRAKAWPHWLGLLLSPDFLWSLVALSQFMRPSLRKGAHAALSSAEWQEIRVLALA